MYAATQCERLVRASIGNLRLRSDHHWHWLPRLWRKRRVRFFRLLAVCNTLEKLSLHSQRSGPWVQKHARGGPAQTRTMLLARLARSARPAAVRRFADAPITQAPAAHHPR